MTEEIWKRIPGFSRYEVSNYGRVKSYRFSSWPRALKPFINKDGYSIVSMTNDNGKVESKLIHQLVMLTFVGPRPEGMEVCHYDSNPQNNQLYNLRYDTHAENMKDRYRWQITLSKIRSGEILIGDEMTITWKAQP